MRNIALAATAAALLLSGTAQAAGLDGFYAGISAGEEFSTVKGVNSAIGGGSPQPPYNYHSDGGTLGLLTGFNFTSGNALFGVEADADWSGIDSSATFGSRTHHVNANYEATVRGRVGILSGANLVYATAGYAMLNEDVDISFTGSSPYFKYSQTKTGWVAGLGVEHSFDDQFSGRIEYRYADYGSDTNTDAGPNAQDVNSMKSNAVRGALIMHF